ncbi:MAG TPA: carbohydrate kinase family protein [Acidobacteriota bacterium]|nr:carbohydrate kinase family protein [Acidobacteriota bacterium]
MKTVLFVGDINIDIIMGGLTTLPVVDREITCSSYDVTLGSAAAICACAYASLGGDASFAGLAGMDDDGEFMLRGMKSFGVNTDLVRRTHKVRTGVTVNLIYEDTRSQVTYPGTIAEYDGSELTEELLGRFDHLHLAGPYQQTRFRPRISVVLDLARRLGKTTSLDTQWDPTETWEFLDDWLPVLDYLFLNEDEALSFTGVADPEKALLKLAGRTAMPVIKLGPRGALVICDGQPVRIPAKKVEVVDTTGAGDTFDAAFLFGRLEKGMDVIAAARFGNAAAGRSCTFPGGVEARSSYEAVLEFIREKEDIES